MSPDRDSQRRSNDDQEKTPGAEPQPERRPATQPKGSGRNRRNKSRYSATEMGKRARSVGTLGMIPVLLGVGPIIGLFIGQWLDKKFDSAPWLTALFVILGFVAAVREMIQLLKRYSGEDNTEDEAPRIGNDTRGRNKTDEFDRDKKPEK